MRFPASSFLSVALAAFALGGCAGVASPCMAAAPQPITASREMAIVVFAREWTICDRGGFMRIVDGDGAYLGDVAADARFAVALAPGEHTFTGWDASDDGTGGSREVLGSTSAVKATLEAGRTYYVTVQTLRGATIRSCSRFRPGLELVPMTSHSGLGGEVAPLLASTEPQLPKLQCGEAELRDAKRLVDRHIREGSRKWATYGEQTRRERTILAEDGVGETP